MDQWNGFKISLAVPQIQVITDASPWGYGAVCQGHEASGFWTKTVATRCQNYRELMAVLAAVDAFMPILRGKSVQVLTDNISAMTYINHGGGPSAQLTRLAKAIWFKTQRQNIQLTAGYLAGHKNTHADRLSRLSPKYEWSLTNRAFRYIDRIWQD